MGGLVALLLLVWLMAVIALVLRNRCLLAQLWAEPVLRRPVLIIESDDWGAGPPEQTVALQRLAAILLSHQDSDGRHPVMTLGVVLASADTQAIKANGLTEYQRLGLDDECYAALRQTIKDGVAQKVFSTQLHGMEHYWPAALMQAAGSDESIRRWLTADKFPQTEQLPSHLQSRWVNANVLPAQQLDRQAISVAVEEELALYKKVFGAIPQVVVPPTFVWNPVVEESWAHGGVEVVVTPGQRYQGRDHKGAPCSVSKRLYNGERAESGVTYIVRDNYFEPSLGHIPEQALQSLTHKTAAARPTLLETHRFNFSGEPEKMEASLQAIEALLKGVLIRYPMVAFLSTGELADLLVSHDNRWVNEHLLVRVRVWMVRLSQDYRLRKFFWLSGLGLVLWSFQGSSKSASGER